MRKNVIRSVTVKGKITGLSPVLGSV